MSSMQSLVLPQVLFLTDLAGKSQSEGFSEMLDLQKFPKVSQEKLWSPCWSKRQNGDDADFVNQILVYSEMFHATNKTPHKQGFCFSDWPLTLTFLSDLPLPSLMQDGMGDTHQGALDSLLGLVRKICCS